MWNILQLALVAPAVVLGLAVPPSGESDRKVDWSSEEEPSISVQESSQTIFEFKLSQESATSIAKVHFQLEVLESDAACGYGNVTFDGHPLEQKLDGSISSGKGAFITADRHLVAASWTFQCIQAQDGLDVQQLDFVVEAVDERDVPDAGVTLSFKQTAPPKIIQVLSALPQPDLAESEHLVSETNLDYDLAKLHYLEAQLRELQHLIREQKMIIARRTGKEDNSLVECDSLKCLAKNVHGKVRDATHKLLGKMTGQAKEDIAHFPKLHWPKPPFHKGKPGNHTCGPPKHGKGNHTHPPPHFRKPHFPLPVCRYPPPPHHPPPPHYPPPHHSLGPKCPPCKTPHHGKPDPDKPDKRPPPPMSHPADQGILQFTQSEKAQVMVASSPPQADFEAATLYQDPPNPKLNALFVFLTGVLVFIATLTIKFLHRKYSNPAKKAARQTRRAERRHRRSLRRAIHKQALSDFLARLATHLSLNRQSPDQDEEKLAAAAESGDAESMTGEIAGLRNAADMVSDMIAAEEGRRRALPIPVSIRGGRGGYMRERESDEESLPAYESGDEGEQDMGSVVADGFRYTPGSMGYVPSPAGNASDILGPDNKQ